MSQIRFYRALLWLPFLVPAILAPLWLVPGAANSTLIGLPLYILTFGILYVAVPYAGVALWMDRWLRATSPLSPAAIWRRVVWLPVHLVLPYVAWQTLILTVTSVALGWQDDSGENLIAAGLLGTVWVVVVGYAYVGLACGMTRVATWAGCVRAPEHASAT